MVKGGDNMDIQILTDYAGFDGQSYFCRHCGKAGFKSLMAVRGHQSACPAKSKQPILPQITYQPQRAKIEIKNDVGGGATGSVERVSLGLADKRLAVVEDRLARIEQTLYNEVAHLQRQSNSNWWEDKSFMLLIVGVIAVGLFLQFGKKDQVGKFVSKAGDKVLNKAFDKALGKLF